MIHHRTFSIVTTSAYTWITTVLLNTSQLGWAFTIIHTLGSTACTVGISYIRFNTSASGNAISFSAYSIFGTRVGITGINMILWFCKKFFNVTNSSWNYILLLTLYNFGTTDESIAFVAFFTTAVGRVGYYRASGVMTTGIGTRIFAFLLNTSLVRWTFTV